MTARLATRAGPWPTHDAYVVVLAVVVAAGAWWAAPIPWPIAGAGAALALVGRRPVLLVVALGLLASALAARAEAGMTPPASGRVEGVATLVGDPVRESGAVRAELGLGGRRVEGWARGEVAATLERRLAGERLVVRGSVSTRPVPSWLRVRHVVARVDLDAAVPRGGAHPLHRVANGVRRLLHDGARSLDPEARALFTGLVIGDDRLQSPEVADDFRGAGLSHLLAVSGQNVAFVLAVIAPASRRLGFRSRLVLTVAVLVVFATVTRFEPSVLRATVMAGAATWAATLGRPTASIRLLASAVAVLVLVDPFLVRSVGFGLSVSASAGILWWSGPIARAVPGPQVIGRALGVVLAAQAGVAPLLLAVFGGVPVVGVVANLAAEPVAGLVMVWGSSAGLLAGIAPSWIAELVHLPTGWSLVWISGVARWATDAGLGELAAPGAATALAAGAVAVWARGRCRALAVTAAVLVLAALATPGLQLRLHEGPRRFVGVGTLWPGPPGAAPVLELDAAARPEPALRALRAGGVDHVDAVVLPSGGAAGRRVVALLGRRIRIDRVVVGGPVGAP